MDPSFTAFDSIWAPIERNELAHLQSNNGISTWSGAFTTSDTTCFQQYSAPEQPKDKNSYETESMYLSKQVNRSRKRPLSIGNRYNLFGTNNFPYEVSSAIDSHRRISKQNGPDRRKSSPTIVNRLNELQQRSPVLLPNPLNGMAIDTSNVSHSAPVTGRYLGQQSFDVPPIYRTKDSSGFVQLYPPAIPMIHNDGPFSLDPYTSSVSNNRNESAVIQQSTYGKSWVQPIMTQTPEAWTTPLVANSVSSNSPIYDYYVSSKGPQQVQHCHEDPSTYTPPAIFKYDADVNGSISHHHNPLSGEDAMSRNDLVRIKPVAFTHAFNAGKLRMFLHARKDLKLPPGFDYVSMNETVFETFMSDPKSYFQFQYTQVPGIGRVRSALVLVTQTIEVVFNAHDFMRANSPTILGDWICSLPVDHVIMRVPHAHVPYQFNVVECNGLVRMQQVTAPPSMAIPIKQMGLGFDGNLYWIPSHISNLPHMVPNAFVSRNRLKRVEPQMLTIVPRGQGGIWRRW